MRIIVPVKQLLDPRGITVRRDKERVFINREEYILDPGSKAAIEAALRLKEGGQQELIALCMGKARADDALREALAMGCDRAILLSDPAFDEADVAATATVLAAAVRKLDGADLIVAGLRSGDTGAGQIGPRLAEALQYAQVTGAYSLAAKEGPVQATMRWGDGFATVQVRLPAVVTVEPSAFPPRLPHGARIMAAYQEWEVTAWNAADLGLDEGALAPVLRQRGESFPPPLESEVLRGDPETVAADLVAALKQQRLIQ